MSSFTKKAFLLSAILGIALPQALTQGGYGGGGGGSGGWSSGGGSSGGSHGGSSGGWSSGGSHGGGGGGWSSGHKEPSYPPQPYKFNYDVNDHYSGAKFGQREHSDGQNVNGEYRVLLPDGRTQIVTYRADWKNGFIADVKYQGEARYPEPSKGWQQPKSQGWQQPQSQGWQQPQQSHSSSGGYSK